MGLIAGIGSPQAFSSASGGKMHAFNTLNAAGGVEVAPQNPSRVTLTFHNPGTVDALVYPAINSFGNFISPSNASRGGAFLVFANGGTLVISGEIQTAWNAISVSGANNPLTVMDSNI